MAGPSALAPTPTDIGVTPKPEFAVTPDPASLFAKRAARFREIAPGHPLEDYLGFLAELSQIQHDVQQGLPDPTPPSEEAMARSQEFGMPPIDRGRFEPDEAALETLSRLLDRAVAVAMPEPAAEARARLAADPKARRTAMVEALENAAGVETLADHVFASAALQVHFARLAGRLDASRLAPVGVGACPACGG
ncbi:formate dehydrogenase accessory protein FdhE, partial [Hansschlegelia zhihuaiae]|uniref:formate dehydrogenase accessory protein FdhE domain-containing protein n=1 Tax=Hansschlegelia zhihuaiae TaxID=405005 RepID=UPI001FE0E99A